MAGNRQERLPIAHVQMRLASAGVIVVLGAVERLPRRLRRAQQPALADEGHTGLESASLQVAS